MILIEKENDVLVAKPTKKLYGQQWSNFLSCCRSSCYAIREGNKFKNWGVKPDNLAGLISSFKLNGLEVVITEDAHKEGMVSATTNEMSFDKNKNEFQKYLPKGWELFDHQVPGIEFILSEEFKSRILGDDMGLGKTLQSLIAFKIWKNENPDGKLVVICPLSLKDNWLSEAKKLSVEIFEIYHYEELKKIKYLPKNCFLIVDEIHKAKNLFFKKGKNGEVSFGFEGSSRAMHVRRLAMQAERCVGLTGTPLLKSPKDLVGCLASICADEYVYEAKEVKEGHPQFLSFWNGHSCFKASNWGGIGFGEPKGWLRQKLQKVLLRRTKEQCLDLPEKMLLETVVQINKGLAYKCDEFLYQYGEALESGMIGKIPFEELSGIRREVAEAKIPIMLELIENHFEQNETPLVVVSAHRGPIDELENLEGWATITGSTPKENRAKIVEQFQNGELKGVGLTIQAGGVGLTLTAACDMIVVSMEWNPGDNDQAFDRIHRIGQNNHCRYIVINADHDLDRLLQSKHSIKRRYVKDIVDFNSDVAFANQNAMEVLSNAKIGERKDAESLEGKVRPSGFSEEQEEWIKEAVTYLTSLNADYASKENGIGWNKYDTKFGHSLASQIHERNSLSWKQYKAARKLVRKYEKTQLGHMPWPK